MVGPYVTTLGGYSLAVNAERFLLEDPASHSILSLHPAVSTAPGRKPSPFLAVDGFATGSGHMEVTWRPVDGIEAVTTVRLADAGGSGSASPRLELRVRFRNVRPEGAMLTGLHPLFFAAEGPGALALGREELRTLASRHAGGRPCLLRLDGPGLASRRFGAWFAQAGSPLLLLAAADAAAALHFRAEGARGKMLALRVDWDAPATFDPGATLDIPPLDLVLGQGDIHDELRAWSERAGAADCVPEFAASGELAADEPEPEPEAAPAPEPEPEIEAEPQPVPEAELEPEATPAEPVVCDTACAPEALAEPSAADAPSEPAAPPAPAPEAAQAAVLPAWGQGRCAAFRRAMRATRAFDETGEGAWPRWASGRRRQPVCGTSVRTRGYWRATCPPGVVADAGE